jgi:acetyl-CoA carboxylase biotin carboxyl carrier protein
MAVTAFVSATLLASLYLGGKARLAAVDVPRRVLGLALLSKFSAFALLPAAWLLMLAVHLRTAPDAVVARIPWAALSALTAALVIWAAYRFDVSTTEFFSGIRHALFSQQRRPSCVSSRAAGPDRFLVCAILPIHTGFAICGGAALPTKRPWLIASAAALLPRQVASGALVHPDYFACTNELAGEHPERILADSYLDWDPGMRGLALRFREPGMQNLTFKLNSSGYMIANGHSFPRYELMPDGDQPNPGWNAIHLSIYLYYFPPTRPASASPISPASSSLPAAVLTNSSWRAPLASAMAFQPFWVGTVMRIFTGPLASRTGRITPGIIDRISGHATSLSSTGRRSSRMLCSILSLPCAVLSRKAMAVSYRAGYGIAVNLVSCMTNEEIRELIQLAKETGVAELEVQRGDNRLRIRTTFGAEAAMVIPQMPAAAAPPAAPAKAEAPATKETDSLVHVKSPIVGTYYDCSSPGAPPFVSIGERVTPGKVLCIIESMKLMNEIEADVAGVIESKLVENGQPVEYGEALFGIRPV